jgi:2-aminoadipate transaminase
LAAMDSALRRELPQSTFKTPGGGFFFWIRLSGLDGGKLREEARAFNVGFRQGALFSSRNGMQDYIRLCYTFYDEENIEEGIRRLRKCLESLS